MHAVISMQYGCYLSQGQRVQMGIEYLTQGWKAYEKFAAEFFKPLFLVQLAGACLRVGDYAPGLDAIALGMVISEKNGERRHDAELHRVQGELLLASARDEPAAETQFMHALQIARAQQAKSLELRAACSLARLWRSHDQHLAARELLAPVFGWFTEGFDTRDLRDAKSLLQELP